MARFLVHWTGTITALGVLTLAASLPVGAQTPASASGEAQVMASPVAGSTRLLLGGQLWFDLVPGWRFGGGGWTLPRATREGTLSRGGLEAEFGYGGAAVERSIPGGRGLAVGLLLGGGSVTVADQVTGATVDAESFVVLEPRLSWSRPLSGRTAVMANLGYRQALAVGEIPRIVPGDLSSWTLSLGVRVGPF